MVRETTKMKIKEVMRENILYGAQQLSFKSGFSVTTVRKVMKELIENEEVIRQYRGRYSEYRLWEREDSIRKIKTQKELKSSDIEKKDEIKFPIVPKVTKNRKIKFPQPCGRCLWCGKVLTKHIPNKKRFSRYFCPSDISRCSSKFNRRYTWRGLRKLVLRRDGRKCTQCGYLKPKRTQFSMKEWNEMIRFNWFELGRVPKLTIDHIQPLATGGDFWSLANLQTLCELCHRQKTRLDIVKIRFNNEKILLS